MSYRDILVHLDETAASVLRARTAAEIASRTKAHLTGVFLMSEFLRQFMVADWLSALSPEAADQIVRDHREAVRKASEQGRTALEAAAAEAGVESDWITINGDDSVLLVVVARRADLTVFPKSAHACLGEHVISAADLGLACGGPILVLPVDDYAPPVGKRVLVAWNGSREAARALRDAWPLIAAADERHILIVSPNDAGTPDAQLESLFKRHGCEVNLILDSSRDESAAEVLDRQIAELDIDLLVMGLYGHPRLQEAVLGGVSRHMLSELRVPLFISH